MKVEDDALTAAAQIDRRFTFMHATKAENSTDKQIMKASGRSTRSAVDKEDDDRTRAERDAIPCGHDTNQVVRESPLYWAPYIHFGVWFW